MNDLESAKQAMGMLVQRLRLDDRHKRVAHECMQRVREKPAAASAIDALATALATAARRAEAHHLASDGFGLIVAAYFGWELGARPTPEEHLRILGSVLGALKGPIAFESRWPNSGTNSGPDDLVLGLLAPFEDTEGVALSWRMVRR